MSALLRLFAALLLLIALPVATGRAAPAPKASDDQDYLMRLGMMEGHLIIGHELLQAKRQDLGLIHFGHPARELYEDIADYLKAHQGKPFDADLATLEALAAGKPDAPETEAKYQAVIAEIHAARALAPEQVRASVPEMIKVCAATVDAAAGEYGGAIEKGRIASNEEYHDSRGYLEQVALQTKQLKADHPDAADRALVDRFDTVLAKAQRVVAPLIPEPKPRATVEQYKAIAAEATKVADGS